MLASAGVSPVVSHGWPVARRANARQIGQPSPVWLAGCGGVKLGQRLGNAAQLPERDTPVEVHLRRIGRLLKRGIQVVEAVIQRGVGHGGPEVSLGEDFTSRSSLRWIKFEPEGAGDLLMYSFVVAPPQVAHGFLEYSGRACRSRRAARYGRKDRFAVFFRHRARLPRHARLPGCPTQPVYHQEALATNQFGASAKVMVSASVTRRVEVASVAGYGRQTLLGRNPAR